jgi:hypothetical protein
VTATGMRMFIFGPGLSCRSERAARVLAKRELRSQGFRWDRGAMCWHRDSGYGLINFQRRWIVLSVCGEAVRITDKEPPRSRAAQAFLAAEMGTEASAPKRGDR